MREKREAETLGPSTTSTINLGQNTKNLLFENRIAIEPVSLESLKWMRTSEAAQYLRTSIGSIKNMVYRGQLISRKVGRRNLFLREDLDRAVKISFRKKGEF